jgi:hypothetical protein
MPTQMLRGGVRLIVGLALVALLAAGIPVFWVWVGSQVQGGTSPTGTAIVTVICGLIVSYSIVAVIIAWAKGRASRPEREPVRFAWNRSLRDERYRPAATSFLENVLIAATIVVAIIVTVWFFLFGNPGVPGG